jgi:hypothetical protein
MPSSNKPGPYYLRRKWISGIVISVVVGVALMIVGFRGRSAQQQRSLCWDAPATGKPVSYQVIFDGVGNPLVTTGECVRLPALSVGDHVAEVRATGADGRTSPAAVLRFTIQ